MAAKIVKKEIMNDDIEIKEFGEDAQFAINELLGLYGFNEEQKFNEMRLKLNKKQSCKITNTSKNLIESKSKEPESENLKIDKMNDYSSISSEKDSSREDSNSPLVFSKESIDKTQDNNCSWCHQIILTAESNEVVGTCGNIFCSENCFLYFRRASFKRAKTCDFCKNIRNAVSYVVDGTTQLQFCSERCLNQYKMKIFCRETQTQIELNPHLKENNKDSGQSLITPADWLKNCRLSSPEREKKRFEQKSSPKSPSPISFMSVELNERMISSLRANEMSISSLESSAEISGMTSSVHSNSESKKPLINVLPSSKLLARNLLHHKNLRKKRVSTRLTQSTKINQVRPNRLVDSHFSPDLRGKAHTQISSKSDSQSTGFNVQHIPNQTVPPKRPPTNLFKLRMPFSSAYQQTRMPILQQHLQSHENDSNLNLLPPLNSMLPPSVVIVPYPIMLPIILPIPLPLTAFLKAYQTKKYSKIPSNEDKNNSFGGDQANSVRINENEQPLDLSSEQGAFYENDKNLESSGIENSTNNKNEDVSLHSEIEKSGLTNNNNNNLHEKVTQHESVSVSKMQHHVAVKDAVSENHRPLRKRKIIGEELSKSQ